jgi:DNA-binding LacI/PurR family transcriptional regulator
VAQNDESAIGIIEALQEAGLRVPQDVSVVGFDGAELARHYRPQLTTLHVPLHEIGARGAQLLIEQMDGSHERHRSDAPETHETIMLPAQLQIGGTTASP